MINFIDNLREVNQLMKIHATITGRKRGRRINTQALNKSAIVLTTAVWESFIEELASASFNFLLNNSSNHKTIPFSVLTKASQELIDNKDQRRIWELADDGWRKVLKKYKTRIIDKEIDHFHVPRPKHIDELFNKLIGFKNITSCWKWKGKSNAQVKRKLNEYIDLRGAIAHKLKSDVLKKDVVYYRKFLNCIAVITHNRVNNYLLEKTKKKAWNLYKFRTIK